MEKIQQGSHFYVNIIDNANIQKPKTILLMSPIDKEIRMTFSVRSTSGAVVELFEDTTISNTGTSIKSSSNNRKTKNNPTFQIFKDSKVSTDGVEILKRSDTNINFPGNISIYNELVLKPDTKYNLQITPFTNGSKLEIVLDWNEF